MNIADGLDEIVGFIYDDDVAFEIDTAGLPCWFVQEDVVWQDNQLFNSIFN